jgi:ribose transport system ATP-binding protein
MDRIGIRRAGPRQPAGELSGGNQQKVALARLLHHDVDLLILDEPTRGIDVGSKAQIYALLDLLAAGQGDSPPRKGDSPRLQKLPRGSQKVQTGTVPLARPRAVLMVSSYLPELLGLCDRIAVMCRGRLGPARPTSEWTEHSLLMEASGAQTA